MIKFSRELMNGKVRYKITSFMFMRWISMLQVGGSITRTISMSKTMSSQEKYIEMNQIDGVSNLTTLIKIIR